MTDPRPGGPTGEAPGTHGPRGGRVLVIEDDPLQAESLAFILRQEGYVVDVAATGQEGLALARGRGAGGRSVPPPDIALVDVALPDLNGVEVTRRLRASASDLPIVLVTGRRQEADKIVGLDAGADDYVTKPFGSGELLARIRAHLRRATAARGRAEGSGHSVGDVFTIGDLRLDVGTHRVSRGDHSIDVSAREFEILRILAEAAGRVVAREHLFESVWGPDFYGDERALDVYVRMIRKKIEPDPSAPRYLHTVRGVGYRLADEEPQPAPMSGGRS